MKINFQKIILFFTITLLILVLTFVAFAISQEKINKTFPPVTYECPDYWNYDVSNNKCINVNNLGKPRDDGSIISDIDLKNFNSSCEKYAFSKDYNLSWEGISNNNDLINICY